MDGRLAVQAGQIVTVSATGPVPVAVPAAHLAEVRALIGLRETVTALLDAEAASTADEGDVTALRGPVGDPVRRVPGRGGGRSTGSRVARTGRVDEHGQDVMRRVTPRAWSLFRVDPHAWTVAALEVFDEASQTATPADILHRRVVTAREPVTATESVDDALAVCLDGLGRPDLDTIARLLRRRRRHRPGPVGRPGVRPAGRDGAGDRGGVPVRERAGETARGAGRADRHRPDAGRCALAGQRGRVDGRVAARVGAGGDPGRAGRGVGARGGCARLPGRDPARRVGAGGTPRRVPVGRGGVSAFHVGPPNVGDRPDGRHRHRRAPVGAVQHRDPRRDRHPGGGPVGDQPGRDRGRA